MREPRPVGDMLTAYRRVLQRARNAEANLRTIKAENARLRAIQEQGEQQ